MLASTIFFAGVVTAQIGNAITCRTEKPGVRRLGLLSNPLLWVGIATEIALALALIYVRPLAETFHHAALPPLAWVGLGLYAPLLYGLDRLFKARANRHAIRRQMLSEGTGL